MRRFFCSDYHFFHQNIIRYSNRPFADLQAMHRALVENWNRVVGPQDTVYFVGDFSFAKNPADTAGILKKLNGYKILILGNHDESATKMRAMGFDEAHQSLSLHLDNTFVLLHHYPYRPPENVIPAELVKKFRRRPVDKGAWLIHGHVHDHWKQKGRMINVSAEMWNYTPVAEAQLIQLIKAGPQDLEVQPSVRVEDAD